METKYQTKRNKDQRIKQKVFHLIKSIINQFFISSYNFIAFSTYFNIFFLFHNIKTAFFPYNCPQKSIFV